MGDRITDERLRKILERKLYFGLDEGQAIAAELFAARADLREAVKLIRLTCSGYESPEWKEQAAELLHRHKETPSG